jgi:hypothetical protein
MTTNLELESMGIPQNADVEIAIKLRAQANVTAVTAQRKVSRLMLDRVSNLLCGNEPTLVVGDRLRWRVPIWLGFPKHGLVGKVGEIDVDLETGEMLFTESLLEEIGQRSDDLARRTLSTSE